MSGFLSGLLRAAMRGGRRAYEQSRREAEAAGHQRLAAAERKAQDLFARLDAGIEATEAAAVVRELDTLKQEFEALGAMSGTDAAGILRELEALKQNVIRKMDAARQQEYDAGPTTSSTGRPATDRQLDYIESLLDSAEMPLNDAARRALGRSVSMDSLLTIDEASNLIDYLKELPGDRQKTTTRRRGAAPRERKPGMADELRPLLNRTDVLVVDVETTGFGDRAEVLAVAAIDTTGRVRIDTVSMPQGRIPTDASNVHGLTRPRLRSMGARPWPEVQRPVPALLGPAASPIEDEVNRKHVRGNSGGGVGGCLTPPHRTDAHRRTCADTVNDGAYQEPSSCWPRRQSGSAGASICHAGRDASEHTPSEVNAHD